MASITKKTAAPPCAPVGSRGTSRGTSGGGRAPSGTGSPRCTRRRPSRRAAEREDAGSKKKGCAAQPGGVLARKVGDRSGVDVAVQQVEPRAQGGDQQRHPPALAPHPKREHERTVNVVQHPDRQEHAGNQRSRRVAVDGDEGGEVNHGVYAVNQGIECVGAGHISVDALHVEAGELVVTPVHEHPHRGDGAGSPLVAYRGRRRAPNLRYTPSNFVSDPSERLRIEPRCG